MKTPRAYYNENDPFAAHWLYNLIQAKLIAAGDIDTRDIRTVKPGDLAGYTQCHFFAGIGGWSLALRLAGIDNRYPIWTGSCPCQPFSAAGKRQGFADDRHLWPWWRDLIAQRRPAVVFGEQVASAAQWLRLVRGDLEGLDYAVGCCPVEAASAGADHLRDRYWFVGHDTRVGRGEGRAEYEVRSGRPAAAIASGAIAVGNADLAERGIGDEQPAGQFPQQQQHSEACDSGDMGLADGAGSFEGQRALAPARHWNSVDAADWEYAWAIGADGKARRVKPGVRLLVDGFPNRVGLLRGFGNAIDPRPASAFIKSAIEALGDLKPSL